MNSRSQTIIMYRARNGNRNTYCRLCIGNMSAMITGCSHNNRTCCSYGGTTVESKVRTEHFHFNNELHVPVLTTTVCKICTGMQCNLLASVNYPCQKNIYKYVMKYLQNINRIGIENIKEEP